MDWKPIKIMMVLLTIVVLSGAAGARDGGRLKLATTTSLYDTKLLDLIEQKFEEKYNVSFDILSGGTGIAIQYGERGDVDALIVHDKPRELKFIQDGHGLERRCIGYNYFALVGPKDDPAGIKV
jgi:tungstate transport system substrate-binding protein